MSRAENPIDRQTPIWDRLRQRLQSLPPPVAEDSIALRVLVQGLVLVGIVATDVAAETQMSWWAIPLSIAGATWSGYRRHDRNILVKFVLAIAMLLALGNFLGELLGSLNDTRLVLAKLLIQIQVLHTFDLPRRKDLGYSMIIGLILLGVAGTVSQTLVFGPFLFLFLALALPALALDYRSRLGIVAAPSTTPTPKEPLLPWKSIAILFPVVVALGMILFAVIPRVPGYQLRSLPVSATIDFQGSFDGRNIVSPLGNGTEAEGSGTGLGGSQTGPGKLDDRFYYGFSNEMNQNLRGEMTPQLVMRVRSQAKGFWRVIAFDRYTGQGWKISRLENTSKFNRSTWTYRFMLPPFWSRGGVKEVIQTYSIVSDLPSLIPALDRPSELYFPTKEVATDPEGTLRSPVKLADGLTYSVISQVPYRSQTALESALTNYPEPIRQYYLQVPPGIQNQVRQRALEILDGAKNPPMNPYAKALYLAQYLKQNYQVPNNPLDFPFFAEGEDLVENFLFRCQRSAQPETCTPGGYADHFSTVLTIMLRSIGIPARLVAGYAPGDFNPFTGFYEVKNTDAYAMTEVYFPQYGWFSFDPIPGHEIIPPSVEDSETFSILRQFWQWIAGWIPARVTAWFEDVFGALFRAIGSILKLFFQDWGGIFAGAIALVGFGFVGWLSWHAWRLWRRRRWLGKLHPMERLYQQLLSWSADRGLEKHPAQTPLEYARTACDHYPAKAAEAIKAIINSYANWRYGGIAPNLGFLHQQFQELKQPFAEKPGTERHRHKKRS
jgi:protein-glutamine gamma-glutamyltransferase